MDVFEPKLREQGARRAAERLDPLDREDFCRYLAERDVPTRGMYYPPDGAPEFSHPNLELVPGDLLDRDSLRRALDGIEVVQNVAALGLTVREVTINIENQGLAPALIALAAAEQKMPAAQFHIALAGMAQALTTGF